MQSLHFQADQIDPWMLTFHLPLHRYLSVFAYQAIHAYDINPSKFLPVDDRLALLNLMFFPLRTLVGAEKIDEWLYLLCDVISLVTTKFCRTFG